MNALVALVSLRWRMMRSRRGRITFAVLVLLLPVFCLVGVSAGSVLPAGSTEGLSLLAPSTFFAFAVVAVVAPLAAGGGNELFPADQLVAYPVRTWTAFLASLAVAPINLVWATQVIVLFTSAGLVTHTFGGAVCAAITAAAYVGMVTVAGQVTAWATVGVRHRRLGRAMTWALLASLVAAAAALSRAGRWTRVLDHAPTVRVVSAIAQADRSAYGVWTTRTTVLVVVMCGLLAVGRPVTAWSLRQAVHSQGRQESRPLARRRLRRDVGSQLRTTDRASVWRAPALRRGLVVLAAIPGAVAYRVTASYELLVRVPGLVAAGAGLLFGVNAFCLDGSGALWLASQPRAMAMSGRSKLVVTAECCIAAVGLALAGGLLRQSQAPTATEAVALLGSVIANVLVVVAACARWSILRPHRAELRNPRDTPAPPGTMAGYSLQLALATTSAGLVSAAAAASSTWQSPAAICSGIALLSLLSLRRSAVEWNTEVRRAAVARAVATG